jgi:hypothetical protein
MWMCVGGCRMETAARQFQVPVLMTDNFFEVR